MECLFLTLRGASLPGRILLMCVLFKKKKDWGNHSIHYTEDI